MPTLKRVRVRSVYGLCDPRVVPFQVRYVGCTAQKLSNRLQAHCYEAATSDVVTDKLDWIRALLLDGVEPIAILLESVQPEASWEEREAYWIAALSNLDLLNATKGGAGMRGGLSPSVRAKISATLTGHVQSEETKAKRRETIAALGYKHSEESIAKITKARRERAQRNAGLPLSAATRTRLSVVMSSLVWITDGRTTLRQSTEKPIPDGWRRGRLPRS